MADRVAALRAWAQRDVALGAAVELLINALGGRLLDGPWIRQAPNGEFWFSPKTAAAECAYLSGGERRLLLIAASLDGDGPPVDLGDAITGIDHDTLRLVIAALAHAGGLEDLPSDHLKQCGFPAREPSYMSSDLEEP